MSQELIVSSPDSTAPLVSVAITSFQSEKWLAAAINSVLEQQVDFGIEIVVGDDCSSDGTVAVARGFEEKNPGVVRVLEREAKLGMQRNFFETFEQCRGRYIAWLDADDYWTDSTKLSSQVSLLQADETVSVCAHFVRMVWSTGEVAKAKIPSKLPGRYGIHDIVRRNFAPSASLMFRNGIQKNLPEAYFSLPKVADWALLVEAALTGDVVLMDRTMADYRITPGSAYSSIGALWREKIDLQFYDYLESHLPPAFRRSINDGRAATYLELAYDLRLHDDLAGSIRAAFQAARCGSLTSWFKVGKNLLGTLVARVRPAKNGAANASQGRSA